VPRTAEAVLRALRALPVAIEEAAWEIAEVALPSYPGGPRPSATVTLSGGGARGRGESVAWTVAAHERFAVAAVPLGRTLVGEWAATVLRRFRDPYERAALEAAAIDLALRQAGTSFLRLAGAETTSVRYVVSFEKVADPLARIDASGEYKVDADLGWDDATWAALGATGRVAVVDFKGAGDVADHARARRAVPAAYLEDPGAGPWPASVASRLSVDIPITSVRALDGVLGTPAAVNLKPARMGGVLEALGCAAVCAERGIATYTGGMFEVGVGRAQLRALAAVLSPEGPNDVAPLLGTERPGRLPVDAAQPGFG
jgi:L-alanine-DL-glutamate epimerase-like enolase superfamily enzyme